MSPSSKPLVEPIRGILFDFDGTLVDSEPLHFEAWSAAVADHNAGTDWGDYQKRFVGQTDTWAARTFLSEAGRQFDHALVRRLCDRKHAYYRSRAPSRLAIEETTVAWIKEHAGALLLGVVSSSPSLEVEPVLVAAGVRELLRVLVCGEHVEQHKPHPEPYEKALEALRRSQANISASGVVVLEDSQAGAASALAAGMQLRRVADPGDVRDILDRIKQLRI